MKNGQVSGKKSFICHHYDLYFYAQQYPWVLVCRLFPTSIYGIRLYQNGSSLIMHCDKVWCNSTEYGMYDISPYFIIAIIVNTISVP